MEAGVCTWFELGHVLCPHRSAHALQPFGPKDDPAESGTSIVESVNHPSTSDTADRTLRTGAGRWLPPFSVGCHIVQGVEPGILRCDLSKAHPQRCHFKPKRWKQSERLPRIR